MTPDFCPFEITVNVDGIEIVFDPENQEITIPKIPDDLTPSNPDDDGSTEHEYPVEVVIVVTADDGSETTDDVTIPVVVKNPCADPQYVSIVLPASLASLQYTIGSGAVPYEPIATGDAAIFVKTEPTQHNLCGDIKFTTLFDFTVNDGSVMVFDETNLEFTADSTDETLIDQEKYYTVIVELVDYP